MGLESTNYLAMAAAANSEIQSLLNQLQSEGVDTTKANYYINSIYALGVDGVTAANGNEYQQSMATQDGIKRIIDLVTLIASGSGKSARAEVRNNDKQIQNTNDKAQQMYQSTDQKIQKILDECNGNAETIRDIIKEIEELGGGDNGEAAKIQEALEEQLQIIEENKEILNSDDTDAAGRKAAISAILGAASQINILAEQIKTIRSALDEKMTSVDELASKNYELMGSAIGTAQEGAQNIAATATEYTGETANTTGLATKGAATEVKGQAEQSLAEPLMNNALTMEEGVKLQITGTKDINNGQTLTQGSSSGFSQIASGTSELGSFGSELNEYTQGLGQFGSDFETLIGEFNALVQPMITAIGSYENIDTANQELQTYVSEYTSEATGGEIEQDSDLKDFDEIDENSIKKKNFDFDTNIFRASKA